MPASDWKEEIPADEPERFERYATYLGDLQKKNATTASLDRALHSKTNLGVEAEFEVLPGPEETRVGMFAEARN